MIEIDKKPPPIKTITYSTNVITTKKRRDLYMGCSSENYSGNGDQCVADVIRGIVKAQHRVLAEREDSCSTSCDRSIEDLLSPGRDNRGRRRHNTIPFMLYCNNSCKAFVASGVVRSDRKFNCIESPVFRAKGFVGRNNSCVRIELLEPVQGGGGYSGHTDSGESHGHDGQKGNYGHGGGCNSGCGGSSVCDFFPANSFRPTGICITVDLDAFFGITCLDPITIR